MTRYLIRSWFLLLYFEFVMRHAGFASFHERVRLVPVRSSVANDSNTIASLCRAMDIACVFYFKQVLCLQRSAATVLLLRRFGWPAEMVVGMQLLPFSSHAWVEVEGVVVNDKPYMHEIYQVLERC